MPQSAASNGLWEAVKAEIKTEIGDDAFMSWIEPLAVLSSDEGVITIGAPSKFVCDRVQSTYGRTIKAAIKAADPTASRVLYRVGVLREAAPHDAIGDDAVPRDRSPFAASPQNAPATRRAAAIARAAGLDQRTGDPAGRLRSIEPSEKLTFESFVVRAPNDFAFAAAKRLAEERMPPANPLFLCGATGLGKTHLLHAIAHRRRRLFPDERMLFISAETFLFEFVAAVKHHNTVDFKRMLRDVDILMVDDMQHILGKNYTQEEFFHTFNALADQRRPIVLSADRSPTELDGIEDRMRSRLGWGLVAELHPTDFDLRLAILNERVEQERARTPSLRIEGRVLEFVAQRISADVRTLEGVLNRLVARASLSGRPISVELAQLELQDVLRHSDRKVSVEEIQKKVADHFAIRLEDMASPRRARAVARPRQVAMYLAKLLTQKSLPEIGRRFGGRDHTTVMHAVRKITELRALDSAFDDEVERLRRKLEG